MFGMKAKKEKERLDSIERDLQEILSYLRLDKTNGNFEPFSPYRVFLNGRDKDILPGFANNLKMMFSVAQSKGISSDKMSEWNWLPHNHQKYQLRDWAISCFDKDIANIFDDLDELRETTWSSAFEGTYDKQRISGLQFGSLDLLESHDYSKFRYQMKRADIIAMRACKEQGARWGIECSFGVRDNKILKEKVLLDFYEIKPPTWKPTTNKKMQENYDKMYAKYKKLHPEKDFRPSLHKSKKS